jgi:hypothetical protein
MGMGGFLQANRTVTVVVCVVLIALALVFTLRGGGGGSQVPVSPTRAWFYDVGTGKLFPGEAKAIPPIPAPSGKQLADGSAGGVRAHVFSCGECNDAEQFIGWLEYATPAARALMEQVGRAAESDMRPPDFETVNEKIQAGQLIAKAEAADAWLPSNSEAAIAIQGEAMKRCGEGKTPKRCTP